MRRKSTRSTSKAAAKEEEKEERAPARARRSRRRKRSDSSDSGAEAARAPRRAPAPDTTTEEPAEPVWKVTSSEAVPRGEIQKLKICLTRPPPGDSPDKAKRRSGSQTEEDAGGDERGKGKSKGKHKSKIERAGGAETNNDISGNVQVTSQSPTIAKPGLDGDDLTVNDKGGNSSRIDTSVPILSESDDDDDEPLSVIKQNSAIVEAIETVRDGDCDDSKKTVGSQPPDSAAGAKAAEPKRRAKAADQAKKDGDGEASDGVKVAEQAPKRRTRFSLEADQARKDGEGDTKKTIESQASSDDVKVAEQAPKRRSKISLEGGQAKKDGDCESQVGDDVNVAEQAPKRRTRFTLEPDEAKKDGDCDTKKTVESQPSGEDVKLAEQSTKRRAKITLEPEVAKKDGDTKKTIESQASSDDVKVAEQSTRRRAKVTLETDVAKKDGDTKKPIESQPLSDDVKVAEQSTKRRAKITLEPEVAKKDDDTKKTIESQASSDDVKVAEQSTKRQTKVTLETDVAKKDGDCDTQKTIESQPSSEDVKLAEQSTKRRAKITLEPDVAKKDGDTKKTIESQASSDEVKVAEEASKSPKRRTKITLDRQPELKHAKIRVDTDKGETEVVVDAKNDKKRVKITLKVDKKSPEKELVAEAESVGENVKKIDITKSELRALNESDVSMTDLSDDKYKPSVESSQVADKVSSEVSSEVTGEQNGEQQPERITEKTIRKRLKRDNDFRRLEAELKPPDEPVDEAPFALKPPKRIKWEQKAAENASITKIDLETIQSVYPIIEFPIEPDLTLEVKKERRKSNETPKIMLERKVSLDFTKSDAFESQISTDSQETLDENASNNIIAFNRTISIVDDTASKLRPPPSPAKNATSDVLFITNLVRPFTVKQLKELLERTGKLVEDGFWTDRIKSKCYAQYEHAEDAEETRNALHGVQWPIGNGKKLIIDYGTVEDLKTARNPPIPIPIIPVLEAVPTKENVVPELVQSAEQPIEEKRKAEGPVREWDIGKKGMQRERSRSVEQERGRRRRSPLPPVDDFISRKQKKHEEAIPQRLMDDLFLKTKATPSIYWKPLAPEEIALKQQQRLVRMEEHKRRMAENFRPKPREMGRGSFRRRYD